MRRNDFFKYLLFSGGNPASRVELETENLPYTFYTQPKTLKNYRIYGNTVNGESVGEKTANLLDYRYAFNKAVNINGLSFPYTLGGNRLTFFVKVDPSTNYTFDALSFGDRFVVFEYDRIIDPFDYSIDNPVMAERIIVSKTDNITKTTFSTSSNAVMIAIYVSLNVKPIEPILVNGSTAPTEYEPYGYKIPVIVNEQTTNIYLDEPLAKSNDIADYIDYKLQKRFNADGTSEDVFLPEIAVFDDENEISFGTTVQPSKIYLKGSISEDEVTISQQVQNLQTMRNLQPLSLDDDLQLDVIIPTANLNRIEDDENAE